MQEKYVTITILFYYLIFRNFNLKTFLIIKYFICNIWIKMWFKNISATFLNVYLRIYYRTVRKNKKIKKKVLNI